MAGLEGLSIADLVTWGGVAGCILGLWSRVKARDRARDSERDGTLTFRNDQKHINESVRRALDRHEDRFGLAEKKTEAILGGIDRLELQMTDHVRSTTAQLSDLDKKIEVRFTKLETKLEDHNGHAS